MPSTRLPLLKWCPPVPRAILGAGLGRAVEKLALLVAGVWRVRDTRAARAPVAEFLRLVGAPFHNYSPQAASIRMRDAVIGRLRPKSAISTIISASRPDRSIALAASRQSVVGNSWPCCRAMAVIGQSPRSQRSIWLLGEERFPFHLSSSCESSVRNSSFVIAQFPFKVQCDRQVRRSSPSR